MAWPTRSTHLSQRVRIPKIIWPRQIWLRVQGRTLKMQKISMETTFRCQERTLFLQPTRQQYRDRWWTGKSTRSEKLVLLISRFVFRFFALFTHFAIVPRNFGIVCKFHSQNAKSTGSSGNGNIVGQQNDQDLSILGGGNTGQICWYQAYKNHIATIKKHLAYPATLAKTIQQWQAESEGVLTGGWEKGKSSSWIFLGIEVFQEICINQRCIKVKFNFAWKC